MNVQAPTQTGFGQRAQIGSGQQALGSVRGNFRITQILYNSNYLFIFIIIFYL
jgi:hypothetical protein